jgi:CPA2 family monovalent cation:H+ antiporter-2
VRTRYFDEVEELKRLGATDVVVEEFENAVELMARVLRRFGTPRNVIAMRIGEARESKEDLMRPLAIPRQRLEHLAEVLREVKVESYLVQERDWAANRTCLDIDLPHKTGASIVAIRRDGRLIPNPSPRERILMGDVAYLLGDQAAVTAAMQFFGSGDPPDLSLYESPTPAGPASA